MVTGRVVRFDSVRGYGFIAPDRGGEDVFLHVNDLLMSESYVRPGVEVEFEVEAGDRGLKSSAVRLVQRGEDTPSIPSRPHMAEPLSRPADGDDTMCDVLSMEEYTRDVTEVLLRASPPLTGDQIRWIRSEMAQFAKRHGWTEG